MRTITLTAVGIAVASLVVVCVILATAIPEPADASRTPLQRLAAILDTARVLSHEMDELHSRQRAITEALALGVSAGHIDDATETAVRTHFARMADDDDLIPLAEDFSAFHQDYIAKSGSDEEKWTTVLPAAEKELDVLMSKWREAVDRRVLRLLIMEELVGIEPDNGVRQTRRDGADISERASIAIVDSIFAATVSELAMDKTTGGVTKACAFLQLLDMDTARMLVEPHQTALLRASVQCLTWEFGSEPKEVTKAKITIPVTLWICGHGSDDPKRVVGICSRPMEVAELKASWEAAMGVDYDSVVSDHGEF